MDIRSKEKGLVRKPGKGQGWWGMDMDFKGFGEFGGLDENLVVGGEFGGSRRAKVVEGATHEVF